MNGVILKAIGIDVGSTTVKVTAVDEAGEMVWSCLEALDPHTERQVGRLLERVRLECEAAEDIPLVATGYGRGLVKPANRKVTEITCHAVGIFRELHSGGTLVDIGGQDSKVIAINPKGEVQDFVMSDKCAAGTGRFLENTALRLGVPLDQMGERALSTNDEAPISSTCTVFAESEVISLIARGVQLEAILRGLHRALVKRVLAMIHTVGLTAPLILSGGVALNPAIRQILSDECSMEVVLPSYPQFTAAYGASLIASRQ